MKTKEEIEKKLAETKKKQGREMECYHRVNRCGEIQLRVAIARELKVTTAQVETLEWVLG